MLPISPATEVISPVMAVMTDTESEATRVGAVPGSLK